jgi:hypothetical protein
VNLRPNQGTITRDDGAMLMNFSACAKCKVRDVIVNIDRKEEVEEEEEESEGEIETTVEFAHRCSNQECNHLIATHTYIHKLDKTSNTEEELMECALCGRGTSSRSNNALDASLSYTTSSAVDDKSAVETVIASSISFAMSSSMQKAAAAYAQADQSSDDDAEWST